MQLVLSACVISLICSLILWTTRISNPGRVRNFYLLQNVQTDSEVHPASYSVGTGDTSPDGTHRGVRLHLVLRLKMSGAIPPLHLFVLWCAQGQLNLFMLW